MEVLSRLVCAILDIECSIFHARLSNRKLTSSLTERIPHNRTTYVIPSLVDGYNRGTSVRESSSRPGHPNRDISTSQALASLLLKTALMLMVDRHGCTMNRIFQCLDASQFRNVGGLGKPCETLRIK